jgi:hypothetical protein
LRALAERLGGLHEDECWRAAHVQLGTATLKIALADRPAE